MGYQLEKEGSVKINAAHSDLEAELTFLQELEKRQAAGISSNREDVESKLATLLKLESKDLLNEVKVQEAAGKVTNRSRLVLQTANYSQLLENVCKEEGIDASEVINGLEKIAEQLETIVYDELGIEE